MLRFSFPSFLHSSSLSISSSSHSRFSTSFRGQGRSCKELGSRCESRRRAAAAEGDGTPPPLLSQIAPIHLVFSHSDQDPRLPLDLSPLGVQRHKALEEDCQEVVAASLESMRKLELPAPLCYRPRLKRRWLANCSFKLVNHMWWFEAWSPLRGAQLQSWMWRRSRISWRKRACRWRLE